VAGRLVASVFGILIVLPVYSLGKRIFGQKVALLSTLFLVIHPYIWRFSADVHKESTYLFLLATALWFAWRTIQNERRYPFLFIPFFSALAYLVRPDGFEILLVVFFYIVFIKRFNTPGTKGRVILLLLLSSILLFLPYLFHLREAGGEWTLSKAKSVAEMLGLRMVGDPIPLTSKMLYAFKRLNYEIFSTFHIVYLFFFVIGVVKSVLHRPKIGEGFLLIFGLLHYLVLFLLLLNTTAWGSDETLRAVQMSRRHVLPLLLVSIYWIGDGFMTTYQLISRKFQSHPWLNRLDSKRKSQVLFCIVLIFILCLLLPKILKPERVERLPEKWAGLWMKDQYGSGMTIFTTVPLVTYYANGNLEYIHAKKDPLDRIKTSMVGKKAFYLVIREKETVYFLREAIEKSFVQINRFEGKGMEKVIIYQRVN
jgi:4-amino-4-deoxy-L-arabinose transferase-like glycosyltransferase